MIYTGRYSLVGTVICLAIGVTFSYLFQGEFIAFLGGGISFLLGAVLAVDWFIGKRAEDARALLRSDPYAPVNVMFSISQLTPEMQENLIASRVLIDAIPNFSGPDLRWRFPGSEDWFYDAVVRAVWARATKDDGMPAIRSFGDETNLRRCCVAMTQFFVATGWLRRAAGNQAAQWQDNGYEQAFKSLFGEA